MKELAKMFRASITEAGRRGQHQEWGWDASAKEIETESENPATSSSFEPFSSGPELPLSAACA